MLEFKDLIRFEKKKEPDKKNQIVKGRFKIAKSDDDKRLAFGWANISLDVDGEELVDYQDEMIDPEDLENAAYNFVLKYRAGGEMHKQELKNRAVLVESIVFTEEKQKALGIPEGTLPVGWWIGFYVPDDDLWEKVKDGTYTMFSIEGSATRVEVDENGNPVETEETGEADD